MDKRTAAKIKQILLDLQKNVDVAIISEEKFWKKADRATIANKINFILFTVYLVGFYAIKEWKKMLEDETEVARFKNHYEAFFGTIDERKFKTGLLFISTMDVTVRLYVFPGLMKECAPQIIEASGEPRTLKQLGGKDFYDSKQLPAPKSKSTTKRFIQNHA